MVKNSDVKDFLITAIQRIEEQVGLKEVDSEDQLINMGLVYLFNSFDIGLALDSAEIIKDRKKLLVDVNTVKTHLIEVEEGAAEYKAAVEEGRTVSSYLNEWLIGAVNVG